MKRITRQAEISKINNEERTAEFVISTESIDRHGTSFKLDGWELEAYNRNPIVCYNHHADGTNPDTIIGTSVVYKDGNQLIGKVTFEDEGDNEIADKVWKKINKGTLKMASVGAIPHEFRWGNVDNGEDAGAIYFTRQELLEWSIVSAGSNRDAHKRMVDDLEELKASLEPIVKGMTHKTKNKLREWDKVKINIQDTGY